MAKIKIKILSPTGTIYDGMVSHVSFPGEVSRFSVFPQHAPIISSLVKGNIDYFTDGEEKQTIPIESGFVEVKANQIIVCVEQNLEYNNNNKR